MTILRRIIRAIKPSASGDARFDGYYSQLLQSSAEGAPSAREARQDLDAMHSTRLYRYL